jgi:hypothetical protein
MPPFASVAAGAAFSDFIRSKFQRNIAPVSPSSACFLLLVAFGRCRFRLDLSFVADSLSAVLGCQPDDLRVEFLESRIFTFAVSCKEVGFEIYKIKSLSCDEFELSFHLLNDLGLNAARDFSSDKPAPAPWNEVRGKPSYAEVVRAKILSGANSTPLGKQRGVHQGERSNDSSQANDVRALSSRPHNKSVFQKLSSRKSVFQRISFPGSDRLTRTQPRSSGKFRETGGTRKSVFERIIFPDQSRSSRSWMQNSQDELWSKTQSTQPPQISNLDLNLHLGRHQAGQEKQPKSWWPNERAPATVRCRRCLSSSHERNECTFQIKCNVCYEWGHVAAACRKEWEGLQQIAVDRVLDNFARTGFSQVDTAGWFNPASMTAGPSHRPVSQA